VDGLRLRLLLGVCAALWIIGLMGLDLRFKQKAGEFQ
jgi:hypothetical protein